AAGGAGPSGLRTARGGDLLRGRQDLPGHGAVRDAVVGRLAPSHEPGGAGAPVRDAGACGAGEKVPELTLDRAVRLLRSALDEGALSLPRAILLVDYHVRRNQAARASHEKAWRAKHAKVKFLLL